MHELQIPTPLPLPAISVQSVDSLVASLKPSIFGFERTRRRGRDGLEYSTLAHAFALAGSPTVVATLWNVGNQSAKSLMSGFYGNLAKNADVSCRPRRRSA